MLNVVVGFAIVIITIAIIIITTVLVPFLKQAQQTAKQVQQTAAIAEQTIRSLNSQIKPLLDQTQVTLQDISEITSSAKEQMAKLENSVDQCRALIDRGQRLSEKVYEQVEQPILSTLNNVSAIRSGFKMFFNAFISKKKE